MNIRDLQYLVAVAELQHFGRAADRCHVSQPTLSMQIRKLEDQLGVPLFHRRHRALALTEAGQQFYAAAAQEDARAISARTKAALRAAKARGVRLGRNGAERLAPANKAAAVERAKNLRPVLADLIASGCVVGVRSQQN